MLEQRIKTERRSARARVAIGVSVVALLLAVALPMILFGRVIAVAVTPQGAVASVQSGIGGVYGARAYLLGADAVLRFDARGFIGESVAVNARTERIEVALRAAPITMTITTEPSLADARWRVDASGEAFEFTGATLQRMVAPGAVQIEATHPYHPPHRVQLDAQIGHDLTHHLKWAPLRGRLDIRSEPSGAQVELNGAPRGATPLILDVGGGVHRVRVRADGHQAIDEEIAVTHAQPSIARDYQLAPLRASARITARPAGGVLRVDGAPTDIADAVALVAGKLHRLRYEKAGYLPQTKTIQLRANERRAVAFDLEPEMGEVVIRSEPAAEIVVNGDSIGVAPQRVRLQAVAQRIVLRRDGYRSVALSVTPRASAPLLIERKLQTESAARRAEAKPLITVAAGIKMKLFDPRAHALGGGRFTMGSEIGEPHRRANEFQRAVALTRPFYVGTTEVTAAQFAQYRALPNAAGASGDLPARDVAWLDAVRFCNWMSAQDGLRAAYRIADGRARLDPRADGYRLLSEAEWEWLARVAGRGARARFVWGDADTIPDGSGNFADESAKAVAPRYIPRYNDGFAGVAPAASFPADAAGLYDMAGNVSEWVHDGYDLRAPDSSAVETDPFGRADGGDGRVIKGANYRSARVTELRASYRDALVGSRDDVGFRVARYLSPLP